mmetsp:Transcript_6542/g.7596  ORF Transcript_6542/g.7596 Transcript_6542/m.7596 type:complete len:483 (-) Transcript_6542:258-1706(-)
MSSDNSRTSKSSDSLSRNGSDHPSTNNLNIVDEEGVDAIHDEDLADVDNDISLGNSDDVDLSTGALEYEVPGVSKVTLPKGYIDDAIEEDVMKSADERLEVKTFPIKKVVGYVMCATALFAIIIGVYISVNNSSEKKTIEKRIHETGTAYKLDDQHTFESAVHGTTEAGSTNTDEENVATTGDRLGVWDRSMSPPSAIHTHLLDPKVKATGNVTPVFWQVPFAGGVIQSFMTGCLNKVLASNHKLPNDDTIKNIKVNQAFYVNVDLSDQKGIDSAKKLRLIDHDPEVIVSNHIFYAVKQLLDPSHQGRLFTALRHPVDRIIAEYHYTVTTSTKFFVKTMGFKEFVESDFMDKDWMTRFLIDKKGKLTEADLDKAKEILRTKCLIGLHDHLELSIHLFEEYFGWYAEEGNFNQRVHDHCKSEILGIEEARAMEVYDYVGTVTEEMDEYKKIVELNSYDMRLYWYAVELFLEQQVWLTHHNPKH